AEFRPDAFQERHRDGSPVKVAAEVEHERFEERRAVVEGGTPAVAGDPAIGGRAVLEGHGINAVAEPGLRGQAQVGGRETEFPPALLAADHLALHEPAMAKPASGLS